MKTTVTEENARIGMKVVRGPDWQWYNQDIDGNGKYMSGVITYYYKKSIDKDTWASVEWENGCSDYRYRIGPIHHDLYIVYENPQMEFEF